MASTPRWSDGVVPSYDAIAEQYAEQYFEELDGKPFDRDVLDRFAATVKHRGRVCDLGCGPAQIARYSYVGSSGSVKKKPGGGPWLGRAAMEQIGPNRFLGEVWVNERG